MTTGNTFGMAGPTRNNHDLREFCKPTADLKKGRLFFTRATLSTGGRAITRAALSTGGRAKTKFLS